MWGFQGLVEDPLGAGHQYLRSAKLADEYTMLLHHYIASCSEFMHVLQWRLYFLIC